MIEPARPRDPHPWPVLPDETVSVVVIDDHSSWGELLGKAIADQADLAFLGHATNAAEGLDLVTRTHPHVVLMDVHLHDGSGLQIAEQILARHPDTRVIILTGSVDPFIVQRAAVAGACAFLAKSGGLAQLFDTIRTARPGRMVVDTHLLVTTSTADPDKPGANRTTRLTSRERQVLQHLALGLDATRIAKQLTISTHTCRGHIKSILAKLHCHTQVEALATATRLGLIQIRTDEPMAPVAPGPRPDRQPRGPDHASGSRTSPAAWRPLRGARETRPLVRRPLEGGVLSGQEDSSTTHIRLGG
jgi:DNA-binding NarL/FixJ family response regulator